MILGGKDQIMVGAQNAWIDGEGHGWAGCTKGRGVGGDHACLQAAAEMGGTASRCYPADSLI